MARKNASLTEYIPTNKPKRSLIQARIDSDLYKRFNALRGKKKLKVNVFFEAAIRKYLDENR